MRPMTDTDTPFGDFSTMSLAGRTSMMGRGWKTFFSQGAPEGHYLHVPMMYMAHERAAYIRY